MSASPAPPARPAAGRRAPARRGFDLDGPLSWAEVCAMPELQDLPFRIEQDRYGRLLMSPTANRHSFRQRALMRLLESLLGETALPEASLQTAEGVRVPDVVWMSAEFVAAHGDEDVFAVAPEICAEVMSPANTWAEMEEKVQLYLARGAQEVWICDVDGALHWFGHEGAREASRLAPGAPAALPL